jgi:hypothetical protein
MRRLWAVSVWILLVASTARAQVPPPPPPPPPPPQAARDAPLKAGTATIRGRVVADVSNAPIGRVDVRIATVDSPNAKSAVTDGNGRYELTNLPAGKFTLQASKPNYVALSYGQTRPRGVGQTIELAEGQTLNNINFTLQRGGVITGRIVDEFGDPVTDVQVMAMRSQFFNGERRMMPSGGRPSQTNDLGDYRIFGLPPGQYYVTATFRNVMFGDSDDRSGYAPTYYPGTGSTAEAQRITIAAGQTASGMNMTLLPVRTSRISGKALDGDGKPLVGGMVMAMERTGTMFMAVRSPGQIRPDGSFTVSGITPGNYTLRVGMPGVEENAVANVTVTDGDVNDVQLVAAKGSAIRGRVLVERGATPPKASTLRLFGSSNEPMFGGGQATVNDDFTFEMKAPAGHYTIRMMGPNNDWRLHAVRLNGLDVTDSGFDVPVNGSVSDVAVEVTSKPTGATGKILDDNGQPVRDAWVVLFAQDPQRWSTPTRFISAGRPNLNNVYTVQVPAGEYFAVALTDVEPGEWNDPDFLGPLRDRATRVTVADGANTTVDLKLSR